MAKHGRGSAGLVGPSGGAMSENEWHVVVGGQSQGPFTLEALAARIGRDVTADALVWNPAMTDWTPVRDVPQLAARLRPVRPPAPAPPAPPARAVSAGVAPAPMARRPSGRREPSEEPTLNPFRLIGRSFRWRGRFDRGEFAMLWFGGAFINALALVVLLLGVSLVGGLLGRRPGMIVTGVLVWGIAILDVILAVVVNVGALIRRLNDLGRPSWWVVGAMLPLVNFVLILYLLFAPGDPNAEIPDSFKGAVIALAACFVLAALVGGLVVLAIVVPSLARARTVANEASAIGDIRSVISAQAIYSSQNAGLYESRWDCLYRPQDCIPGYQGPGMLDPSLGETPKAGYVRRLHGGRTPRTPPASPASASSVEGYAIVAWPVTPGRTGVRFFCGDTTGIVCSAVGVSQDALVEGPGGDVRCSSVCEPLR